MPLSRRVMDTSIPTTPSASSAGAAVKTVQLALGHSSPMITLNTYAHEWPDALDRTRALVDAALGSPASNSSCEDEASS